MRKLLILLFVAVGVCSADININFTNGSLWGGADDHHSFTSTYIPGLSITLSASGTSHLQQTTDGIGIGRSDWSQIDGNDILTVSFAPPVDLDSATVDNLTFYWDCPHLYPEQALYQINGTGSWTSFNGDLDGIVTVGLNDVHVGSIAFKAGDSSSFTLKAMDLDLSDPPSVPDGGMTLMLLGGALAGLETLRRKLCV
jgi:hypothetical protein